MNTAKEAMNLIKEWRPGQLFVWQGREAIDLWTEEDDIEL